MAEEVSWLNHAVTATLAALGGFAVMVGGAIARLWGHEGRIKALEDIQAARSAALTALSEKVDAHHAATSIRIDEGLENIRVDLRVILSHFLSHERRE